MAAGFTATESKKVKLYGPVGCDEVYRTSGYKGRLGVFEVMPMDERADAGVPRSCSLPRICARSRLGTG